MDFQKYTSNPLFMTNAAFIVVFMLVFPGYFAYTAGGDGSKLVDPLSESGSWMVSFAESETEYSEDMILGDGDSEETLYLVEVEEFHNIAKVEISLACQDNDDPGPGFTDRVSASTDLSSITGMPDDQSDQSACGGGGGGGGGVAINFVWNFVDNYDGLEYVAEDLSMNDIRAQWSDNGSGRGDWSTTVEMEINSPGPGPIGGAVDDSEEVTITWKITTFKLVIMSHEES
ncbi:hypothetical protein OAJ94_01750 [Deltaproteobacteria bacterium]|nr:hypothetical protein [Deltaproteobacteria bacterium]